MPSYLLELYVPGGSASRVADTARAVAREASAVRHVRTLYVAEDETCFHVFEAPSREVLAAAVRIAGLAGARITEAVESADGSVRP